MAPCSRSPAWLAGLLMLASAGATASPARQPAFHEADFAPGQAVDNAFLPLLPGTRLVYHTRDAGGRVTQVITVTVTQARRQIAGVDCIVVEDVVATAADGALVESTRDYYAQDRAGNVWYFGEDTATLAGGKVVSWKGSWLAGVEGAAPGLMMPAAPRVGDSYRQENAPGVAEDAAEITALDGSACVPFEQRCFDRLLVTLETSALEPDARETKSYARGIGQVAGKDLETGERDELVSIARPGGQ